VPGERLRCSWRRASSLFHHDIDCKPISFQSPAPSVREIDKERDPFLIPENPESVPLPGEVLS